jgi:hypothetical protein
MASSSAPELRASDAEREAAVDRLRDHAAAGRLSADELEERVGRALSARTIGELRELERDLPGTDRPPRRPRARRRRVPSLVAVSLLLIGIWAVSGAGYFWPIWAIGGWWLFVRKGGAACARGHARRRRGTDEVWV